MADTKKPSVFETLVAINCNDHTEKKNGLTYLSWAWAWHKVKENYPDASYTIYEAANGWNYHTDGRTCWVKTGVTINGLEHIEYLPVMDNRNNSIAAERVTSFDVNKAIQRSLTKACARHGLGLYIYAGEDLPADCEAAPAPKAQQRDLPAPGYSALDDETYWKVVAAYATGKKPKVGRDYRQAFVEMTNAGNVELAKFDHDVKNYQLAQAAK